MATFFLKYRDTRPTLEVLLKNPDETIYDLTGAVSATLHVRLSPSVAFNRAMVIDPVPATGFVRYTFLAADWVGAGALTVGDHPMEYEILGPGLTRLTFPNAAYDTISITRDIAQA